MQNILKTYGLYIKVFFKAKSEYKVGFIAGIFANFYSYVLTFFTFWIIVNRFEDIAGWVFEDMSLLYGLNLFSYAVAGVLVWYSVYHLEREITTGRLDLYLTRPMNVLGQLICSRFGETFIGQIIVTFIFLINALLHYRERMNIFIVVYIFFAVIGAVLFQMGAMIIIGAMSFWTLRSDKIGDILYYYLRSLTYYPLEIYPRWIKFLLTFIVPWAFINYYPSLIILRKAVTGWEYCFGYAAPVLGILFFIFSIWFFNKGLNHYTSSGS